MYFLLIICVWKNIYLIPNFNCTPCGPSIISFVRRAPIANKGTWWKIIDETYIVKNASTYMPYLRCTPSHVGTPLDFSHIKIIFFFSYFPSLESSKIWLISIQGLINHSTMKSSLSERTRYILMGSDLVVKNSWIHFCSFLLRKITNGRGVTFDNQFFFFINNKFLTSLLSLYLDYLWCWFWY